MGGYANGRFPLSMLVHLGGKIYLPAGTAARWQWMVAQALAKYGVLLYITPGWNGYRPYDIQVEYRRDLGIWAAVPGYSSHGLIYRGKLVAAADVGNWQDLAPGNQALAWSRFKALCRLAGFTVDFVTPQELWHIGDFNDVWTPPAFTAGNASKPTPAPVPADLMEAIHMAQIRYVHRVEKDYDTEWMIVGLEIPGGFETTIDQTRAEGWGAIYGTDKGGSWKALNRKQYIALQASARELHERWFAMQKQIHS